MTKIVDAINAMRSNLDLISNIELTTQGKIKEIIFLYNKKHKWRFTHNFNENTYVLEFYPDDFSIENLSSLDHDKHSFDCISYSCKDYLSSELHQVLQNLHTSLLSKKFKVDDILDQIIEDTSANSDDDDFW